jgi:hypothetical protein
MALAEPVEELGGAVRGSVVDHDHLARRLPRFQDREESFHAFDDRGLFVEARNDHRELRFAHLDSSRVPATPGRLRAERA